MSESSIVTAEHQADEVFAVLEEMRRQGEHPPDGDESIGALMRVWSRRLPESALMAPVGWAIRSRKGRMIIDTVGLLRIAATVDGIHAKSGRRPNDKIGMPILPEGEAEWEHYFDELEACFTDPTPTPQNQRRGEWFMTNLFTLENQASLDTRYVPAAFIGSVLSERWPNGAWVNDIGASMLQGVNSFALSKDYGLSPAKILGKNGVDGTATAIFNDTANKFHMDFGLATDAINIQTEDDKLWPIGALRHESEIKNPKIMERVLRNAGSPLNDAEIKIDNVDSKVCDWTDNKAVEKLLIDYPGRQFSLNILSVMLYQNIDLEKRNAILDNAQRVSAGNAITIVVDQVDITGPGLHDLFFKDDWFHAARMKDKKPDPGWRVIGYDRAHPELGWQEYFRSLTSRMHVLVPGIGRLAIGNELVSVREYLGQD